MQHIARHLVYVWLLRMKYRLFDLHFIFSRINWFNIFGVIYSRNHTGFSKCKTRMVLTETNEEKIIRMQFINGLLLQFQTHCWTNWWSHLQPSFISNGFGWLNEKVSTIYRQISNTLRNMKWYNLILINYKEEEAAWKKHC